MPGCPVKTEFRARWLPALAWALVLGGLLASWLHSGQAAAHGKELGITVAALSPDPQRPLVRLYRASVVYASDLDPVEGATVELTATRQEGGAPVGPILLTALGDKPGVYVGEVSYPRFGSWTVRLWVSKGGEGETTFVDHVTPGVSSPSAASQASQEERVRRLQLFFRFGWQDVANILVRIMHSSAGIGYFGLTGAMLFFAWFGAGAARPSVLTKLDRAFLPAILTSLGVLLVTGLYTAAFDAPIKAPGIFDLRGMQRLPFGYAYLGAFLAKPLLLAALTVVALRMNQALRALSPAGGSPNTTSKGTPAALRLQRLALANAVLGLLVFVDVAVVVYLHYISHLGVFLIS